MDIGQALKVRLEAVSNLLLRLVLGADFLAHGLQKTFGLFGGGGFAGAAAVAKGAGFEPAWLWGAVLALTELLGGLAVLLGFYTRVAAGMLAFTMAVAIVEVHLALGFFNSNGGFEFPLMLFAVSLALVLSGSGPYSLDTWFRLKHEEHIAKMALAAAAGKEAGEEHEPAAH